MSARILIIDDLETNIRLLESKLVNEYYDVITARSGKQALDILETSDDIDLILLDVMMPEMDGFETCRRIKTSSKNINIPVVMVTALDDAKNRVQGLKSGADDFITKPVIDSSLFARIRSLVRTKTMIDELINQNKSGFGIKGINTDEMNQLMASSSVLIIDDDITQTANLSMAINPITSSVRIIERNIANIHSLLTHIPDLFIISTQLIEDDGLRVCAKILNHPKCKDIPILILVEEGDENSIVKALDLGVSDYLTAPIDKSEVGVRISNQLKKRIIQEKLKASLEQNIALATTDALTGLYNRHYFDVYAQQFYEASRANNTSLSIMILDLDYFKLVNDTYGHMVGDEVLKQTAIKLKENVRACDLVSRFGGEEFVVLMPDTDAENARNIAEKIRLAIENTTFDISHGQKKLRKTTSIGVTQLRSGEYISAMLARADKGLYIAKFAGRNQVVLCMDDE